MTKTLRRFGLAAALLIAFALVAGPGVVSAQMREFTGRIDKISKKKMIVDNRQGDKVSFVPNKGGVEVSGEEKKEWKDLKKKDWVTVSWKFMDKPRKAYIVKVLPPREED